MKGVVFIIYRYLRNSYTFTSQFRKSQPLGELVTFLNQKHTSSFLKLFWKLENTFCVPEGKKYKYYEYSSAHFTHSKESHLPVKKVTLLNWLTGVLNHTLLCMPELFWPALQENFYVPSLLFISSIPRAALKPTNLNFYSLTVLQISVLNVSNSCLALFLWCSLSANLFWGAHLALCFWFVNLLWWKLAVKMHPSTPSVTAPTLLSIAGNECIGLSVLPPSWSSLPSMSTRLLSCLKAFVFLVPLLHSHPPYFSYESPLYTPAVSSNITSCGVPSWLQNTICIFYFKFTFLPHIVIFS